MTEHQESAPHQKNIHARRDQVRMLRIECVSIREIARRLNQPLSTIRRDVEHFNKQYREALQAEESISLAEELDRLCYLESEAWKAWRRSQEPATIEISTMEAGGEQSKTKVHKITRSQVGDRHFLELIEQFAVRRSQLQHLKQAEHSHGESACLQYEQICQERHVITEVFENLSACGGFQDVYACAIRQDSQPRALEDRTTSGCVGPIADGLGDGTANEIDRADAAPTWEI